jgi:WD40 repeat protein
MNLSPDGRYLASVDNSNSNVCIWGTNLPGDPLVKLGGRLEGLSDVSWCPEDELMVSTVMRGWSFEVPKLFTILILITDSDFV